MVHLTWPDGLMLLVLAGSVWLGLWRGLVFELMSLLGWLVAYGVAQIGAAAVAPQVPVGAPGSALNHGASFALLFVVTLVGWALLTRLVRLIVRATPLTLPDRLLGALFGLLRGGVLLLAAATVVMLTPLRDSAAWQQARGAAVLAVLLQGLKPTLPAAIGRHLPD